ncbi:MAG: type II toxin-antitoxin system HipA family toxin [Oleibacter sp.]|nr:type II toxin-antitoxin system HipA family toxin [Thalassolituus sp.]
MKTKDKYLQILMNGYTVGKLTKHNHGGLSFCYDNNWLQLQGARPISLSLPLIDINYSGDLVSNFFDNLLPDNSQMRARIQTMFQTNTDQPFDLLASIGKDCVGAIQLCSESSNFTKNITARPLSTKQIADILKDYINSPLGIVDRNSDFRISIAGAQEKTAFLLNNKKWQLPIGSTPTSHIFKLPIGFIEHQQLDLRDSCENEWLCAEIAKAYGFEVANTYINQFQSAKTLIVERFDRRWSEDKTWLMRLPQEDLCQALGVPSNLKYESDGGPSIIDIMRLLLGSTHSKQDRITFFRTQILFFLLGAIDGHAKNFSIFIEPLGAYRLTPLYDIMSAHPLTASKQLQVKKIKMAMALHGKNKHYHWHKIQRRHFISTATLANFDRQLAESLLDDMLGKVDTIISHVTALLPTKFPQSISAPIFKGMHTAKNKLKKQTLPA